MGAAAAKEGHPEIKKQSKHTRTDAERDDVAKKCMSPRLANAGRANGNRLVHTRPASTGPEPYAV